MTRQCACGAPIWRRSKSGKCPSCLTRHRWANGFRGRWDGHERMSPQERYQRRKQREYLKSNVSEHKPAHGARRQTQESLVPRARTT